MKLRILGAVTAILLATTPAIYSVGAQVYQVEDLGSTTDGFVPTVTGMNASGQVSGYVTLPDGTLRAVRYTNGLGWTYLTGLESVYSMATGINVSGDVVGYSMVGSGLRAFRYADGIGVTEIPALADESITVGNAIADNGDVIGYSYTASGLRAWRASPGLPAVVPAVLANTAALACGVNSAGQMVGIVFTPTGQQHAFRLEADNSLTDIGALEGPANNSSACALDADGRTGGASTFGGASQAFLFTGTVPFTVDTFNSTSSSISAISRGVSVGVFTDLTGETRAFVHTDAGGSVDLNTMIPAGSDWILSSASGVNSNGQIAGNGWVAGNARAFRLTPGATADTTPPVITSVTASPSTIWPPKGQTVTVTTSANATDNSGQTLVCTLSSITLLGQPTPDAKVTGPNTGTVKAVGGRVYTFNETCVDGAGNAAASSVRVTVPADTTAPVISALSASPDQVWPPFGQMQKVTLSITATDNVDATPQCSLTSITSNGGRSNDAAITGRFTANVRAERNNDGSTRVYALNVTCKDSAGNTSTAAAGVAISRDRAAAAAALKAWRAKLIDWLRDMKERHGAGSGRR
jgi:probable HAF family extracellular repeat protein